MLFSSLKRDWLSKENRLVADNIISMGFVQILNYLLPLITVPYLVRIIGVEFFGLLAFSSATITYFVILTDYGFNLSATRQIAIFRNDSEKIDEIFSGVMIIKILLLILSLFILGLLILFTSKFGENWVVHVFTFGTVVGHVLFPVWLFQGMEKIKHIVIITLVSKLLYLLGIFVFVVNSEDYFKVPIILALSLLVSGIWSLNMAKTRLYVSFKFQKFDLLLAQVREGWHVFISSLTISFYTTSTTFILGFYANNTSVGYFAGSDRIVQAVKGIYSSFSQAIYPHTSKRIHDSAKSGLRDVFRISIFVAIIMLFVSIFLFLFAENVVMFLLGSEFVPSILILKIMSFLPLVVALSNLLGVQILLNLGFKRQFLYIVFCTAIFGVSLSWFMAANFFEVGLAYAVLGTEIIITFVLSIYVFTIVKRNVKGIGLRDKPEVF